MEIRSMRAEDWPAVKAIYEQGIATKQATFETEAPPWEAWDAAHLSDLRLVAEEDGEVVGTLYANLSTAHFGYVFGVYTVPGARGRGVGRALMRAIAQHLRDEGRDYVVLSVDTPNEGAREFYDRLGFEDASRMLRAPVDRLLAD
jgi:L-amino acid N-acyltransferase YncA